MQLHDLDPSAANTKLIRHEIPDSTSEAPPVYQDDAHSATVLQILAVPSRRREPASLRGCRRGSADQRGVVKLVLGRHTCVVRPGGRHQVPVADQLVAFATRRSELTWRVNCYDRDDRFEAARSGSSLC